MNAVISGQAGRALLVDGDSLRSFDVDDPSSLVTRVPADFVYIFGEMQDLRVLENTDIESVQRELNYESESALALELALISLDAELPDNIRREAIHGLEELLVDVGGTEALEKILYARPLPEDADLSGAFTICANATVPNVAAILQRLERNQPVIHEISSAWDVIPTKTFGSYEDQMEFQRLAVREGIFRSLVKTFDSLGHLKNFRAVLRNWATLILDSSGTHTQTDKEAWEQFSMNLTPEVTIESEEKSTIQSHLSNPDHPSEILYQLTSENVEERIEVIARLALSRGDDSFPLICEAFDDPSIEVRNAAARALIDLSPDISAMFTRALREGTPERRRKIGSAIASSGLASEMLNDLTGEDRERTFNAFSLLFLMVKAGEVEPLVLAIEDHSDMAVRLAVIKLLVLSGQDIVRAFRQLAVRDSLPSELRSALIEAIYQMHIRSEQTSSVA